MKSFQNRERSNAILKRRNGQDTKKHAGTVCFSMVLGPPLPTGDFGNGPNPEGSETIFKIGMEVEGGIKWGLGKNGGSSTRTFPRHFYLLSLLWQRFGEADQKVKMLAPGRAKRRDFFHQMVGLCIFNFKKGN